MDDAENSKKRRVCRPMLTNIDFFGKELSESEFNGLWGIFDTLSEEVKDILTTPEMSRRIELLQKERGLSDEHIEIISAIIREYFLRNKDVIWLQDALTRRLDQKDVVFVKEYIQKNILTIKPVPRVLSENDGSSAVQIVQLPLLDALAKYQRLSEQTVTDDRISVKGESAPVRGSIRNWLRHYRDAVGIRKHSTMERGQFLFQGENTRRLSAQDREKVSFLLKALDENTPVPIDSNRQELMFPAFQDRGSVSTQPVTEASVPALETSFRPLEKFPAQAAPIQKALEWKAKEKKENIPNQPPQPSGISAPVYTPVAPFQSKAPAKGGMSFSSSHVLPHEKEQEATKSRQNSISHVSESSRDPEAISVIRPRRSLHGAQRESEWSQGSGSDASRVVNLRSSREKNIQGKV